MQHWISFHIKIPPSRPSPRGEGAHYHLESFPPWGKMKGGKIILLVNFNFYHHLSYFARNVIHRNLWHMGIFREEYAI
jgi:hypothetical protein